MPKDLNNSVDDAENKEVEVKVEEKQNLENEGADNKNNGSPAEAVDANGEKLGYPANTRIADMDFEQQAAYWKHHARKHEAKSKSVDESKNNEEVEALKAQIEALKQAQLTDEQKASQKAFEEAVAEARKAAIEETTAAFQPQIQSLQLDGYARAALKNHKDADRKIASFLEFANIDKLLTEDKLVDGEKVKAALISMYGEAPQEGDSAKNTTGGYPNFGQGSQLKETVVNSAEYGKAMAAKRFPKADK